MTGFRFLIVATKEADKNARRFFKDNDIKFKATNWVDLSDVEPVQGFNIKARSYWYYGDDELEKALMEAVNGSKLF